MTKSTGAVAPIVAVFQSEHSVRAVVEGDEAWFVAKDVFEALDLAWKGSSSLALIPDDWKGVRSFRTPSESQSGRGGGEQKLVCVNFKAVCKVAFRSNKPEADKFTNWAAEVIDQIRKTGTYTLPSAPCRHDYLTGDDMRALTRLVWMIAGMIGRHARHAVWHALRVASGCAAPNRFEVRHIPDLATELRRLYAIVLQYRETQMAAEQAILKSCIRGRETDDAVLADLLDRIMTEAEDPAHGYTLVVHERPLGALFDRDILAFIQRTGDTATFGGFEESEAEAKVKRRDDLSFTRRDGNGFLQNWVVPHDPEGDWSEGWEAGAAMFEEVAELAKAGEKSAYDAIRYPLSQDMGFRREGWGIECGFADAVARAVIDGLRARRAGLPTFDPKVKPAGKSPRAALPKGEQAVARLAAEVAAI